MSVIVINGRRFRVLHQEVRNETSTVSVVVDIDETRLPFALYDDISIYPSCVAVQKIYPCAEYLSTKELAKFELAKKIVRQIDDRLQGLSLIDKPYRKKVIEEVAKQNNVSTSKARYLYIKYLISGRIVDSLTTMYPREQKGRKYNRAGGKGLTVTEKDKECFDKSIRKHYLTRELKPLRHAYERCLQEHYAISDESGKKKLMSRYPSYNQFYYFFKGVYYGKGEVIKARYGNVVAKETMRPLLGNTESANIFPSYELDSTILDSYAIGYYGDGQVPEILGRNVLYLISETVSSRIVFFFLSYERFMSEVASVFCLIYGLSCPEKYMETLGIDTNEYKPLIPKSLIIDRGELTSKGILDALNSIGISTSVSASMRGSFKPKVERLIGKINSELAKFVPGTIKKDKKHNPRTEMDYRVRSSLTVSDLAKMCHAIIMQHNNHDVIEAFVNPHYTNGNYTPNSIYDFLVGHYGIIHRTVDPKRLIMLLLTTSEATVTQNGVRFKKLYYISKKGLNEGWIERARIKGRYRIKIKYNPVNVGVIYFYDDKNGTIDELRLTDKYKAFEEFSFFECEYFFARREQEIRNQQDVALEERINEFGILDQIVSNSISRKKSTDDIRSKNAKVKAISQNRDLAIIEEQGIHRKNLLAIVEESAKVNDEKVSADEYDVMHMIRDVVGDLNE